MKHTLFLAVLFVVGTSFFLSGCKVLVDPEGNYEVEFEDNELEDAVDPWIPKGEEGECGIANCHGPVECGVPVEMCTLEYRLGDFCREFATCEATAKGCALTQTKRYTACIDCVAKCEQNSDPQQAFACETQCRSVVQ